LLRLLVFQKLAQLDALPFMPRGAPAHRAARDAAQRETNNGARQLYGVFALDPLV